MADRTHTVRAIRIGRTYNLGNYESERVDVEVTLDKGESFEAACDRARELCEAARTPEATITAVRKLRSAGLTDDEITALGVKLPKSVTRAARGGA